MRDTARRRDRALAAALCVFAAIVLLVTLGPLLSPYAVDEIDFAGVWGAAPGFAAAHWFGTDDLGRDLFVRVCDGGRLSLLVGLAASTVSLLIGVAWGAIAGYCGGLIDATMMRIVDILYAMPFLFFAILLTVLFGRHIVLIFAAIGAINWLDMARIVRGQTLALKQREFVEAAMVSGSRTLRIVFRHIVPNLYGVIVVYLTLTIPQAILIESFLSFLGLGVQEPHTSWGALVSNGAQAMETTPWALILPAGFLAATLLCLNFIGDGLRDLLDVRGARR
jgi:oligopeptide transport system permease protein